MNTLEIIGIVSGLLALSSYFFYIPAILKGDTKPNRASWWIWGGVGVLIVASYYVSGARSTIWVPLSEAIGPAIIALLSIKYGEGGWTRLDRWCLVGAGIGTFLWWFTNSALVGLVVYLFIDLMAVIPTIKKSFHRPEHEDKKAWGLAFGGQLLNLLAVEKAAFSILLYPIYMIITNGVIFGLQFKKRGSKAFSSIDIVSQCLSDIPRTGAFQKAISQSVKVGNTVLDSGTGSGVLALFAAKAGAKKVISLEYDSFIADAAKKVIAANNQLSVEVRIGDGRTYEFEPGLKFDTVIMEMLTTGMIDEYQVSAINNLHRQGVVNNSTVFIPSRQDTFVTLGNFDFSCYGLNVPFIRHTWKFYDPSMKVLRALTDRTLINSIEFSKSAPEKFETSLDIMVTENGTINAVQLSSMCQLNQDITLADTDSLNGPVVVPVERKHVQRGEKVRLLVSYIFGGGYESIHVSIKA
ncbi:MAG: putative RNA methylase [Parcubacteria group bacterium GW2011_GWA2_47_16]|nr:MAG: putative RNA methylase [Parcubacteria group bacterium GW2011_GWA2_47_16]